MAALKFTQTHNLVAFLEKPKESDGFAQIATAKAKFVNGEVQIQALVDGKKVIITEASVRRDLQLSDENGTECLPNATIFAKLERMGNLEGGVKFLMYPRFVQVFLDKPVEGMSKHKEIYVTPSHTKKVFANMKRQGKDFSNRDTPLFQTMMVQAQEEGEGSVMPTFPNTHPPLINHHHHNLNGIKSLGSLRNRTLRVLDLENMKTSQAIEIIELKERVKKLERRNKSRTLRLKRLKKVGRSARIESSEDKDLGDQKDASKQGRKITDIDADEKVTLIDEIQGRNDDLVFDTSVLDDEEVFTGKDVVEKKISTAEPVTTANVVVSTDEVTTTSAITTTVDDLTLAQTLIEIKAAKPKAVTTAATTTTTSITRPKAIGVVVQEPSEFTTTTLPSQSSQLPRAKDKGKAKMIEPEKPLKKKDQILIDEEIAQRLQEELQDKLEEEERLER
ncbi:hypothetical protein Tco_0137839 [Tanacetum coccineum]